MSGHYRMARGWMDHPAFGREPFTRAQAWCWLVEMMAWKDRTQTIGKDNIPVRRGEYATSVRFLAERWQWKRMKAQRFLARLVKHEMIEKSGTANGTANGTQYTLIRLCNYDKYQAVGDEGGTPNGTPNGTRAGRGRDKGEEREEGEEGKKGGADAPTANGKYRWKGRSGRLTETDYERWRKSYPNIPDFDAELQAADDYYFDNPPPGGKWFFRFSNWLKKANNQARADEIDHLDGVEI